MNGSVHKRVLRFGCHYVYGAVIGIEYRAVIDIEYKALYVGMGENKNDGSCCTAACTVSLLGYNDFIMSFRQADRWTKEAPETFNPFIAGLHLIPTSKPEKIDT